MSKSIVIYFSRGDEEYGVGNVHPGNTELLAKEVARVKNADEFKIVPEKPYPADYMQCVNLATTERNENARPRYVGDVDLSAYDTIYLGYPIWWGDLPMIVYTFLESHDFSGKTVIPFNTHEGSGNSGTYGLIQNMLKTATVKGGGFNISGSSARTSAGLDKLRDWLETL